MAKSRKKILKMKILSILLLFTLFSCNKEESVFKITSETIEKDIVHELKNLKNLPPSALLYNDENYEVWNSCFGEWGGSVYFKNKKTGKVFATFSQCAVSVNKINGKYYISNSLSHLQGSCNIIEISNPEKLQPVLKTPIFNPEIETREFETESKIGTKTLVDSFGTEIKTSFIYQNKLYSILKNSEDIKATISEIKNNKFVPVEELPENLLNNEPLIIRKGENHQVLYFQAPKSGTLEIKNNRIKITYYKK